MLGNHEKINRCFAGLALWIKRYRWLIIGMVVLLNIFGFVGMGRMKIDASWDGFYKQDDPLMVAKRAFEKKFGNSDFIAVLVEADDVFAPKTLLKIRQLGRELKRSVPFVDKLISIADYEFVRGSKEGIETLNIVPEKIPNDKKNIEQIRQMFLSKKAIAGRIFSLDSTQAWILLRLKKYPKNWHALAVQQYVRQKPVFLKQIQKAKQQIESLSSSNKLRKLQLEQGILRVKQKMKDLQYRMKADPGCLAGGVASKIINKKKYNMLKLTGAGLPIAGHRKMQFYSKEMAKTFGLGFILSIFFMLIVMRNIRAFFGAIITMISANVILFGGMGWFKITVDPSMRIVPMILILAVSIGYTIHILNFFKRFLRKSGKRTKSVVKAIQETGWPITFTVFTTVGALLSFIFIPIKVVSWMGVSTAVGVFIVYLFVLLFIPAILSFGKDPSSREKIKSKKGSRSEEKLARFGDWVIKRGRWSVTIFSLLLIFFCFGLGRMQVDIKPERIIGKNVKYIKDLIYAAKSKVGSMYSYQILVQFPQEDSAKQPDNLKKFALLEKEVQKLSLVKRTFSLVEIIKDINQVMHADDPSFYRIPNDFRAISQYLLMYEMSGGTDSKSWVDYGYKTLRMEVEVYDISHLAFKKHMSFLDRRVKELFPNARLEKVGTFLQYGVMNEYIISGQVTSIIIALIAISLLMVFVFKSIKTGLIAMIPNIAPVIFAGGLMGYCGSVLDFVTMIIGPMIIGLAVDDTIHFMNHARVEFFRTGSYAIANRETFRTVGKALAKTSFILIMLFAAFMTSQAINVFRLGLYSIIAILVALLSDYMITPVLLRWVKPFGKEEKRIEKGDEDEVK